ncbi:MAG: hypothetical protein PUD52_11200 [Prevotella sp.]|nr:hypothetical protein [Prevotella sp.]
MKIKVLLFTAITAFLLMSCQEKIKTTQGKVIAQTDSTVKIHIDRYDIVFDTKKARCDNGEIMQGDSVAIHYIGDIREKKAKALLLRLIPQKGNVVEAIYDPSKELKTKKMTEQEQREFERGYKASKKNGH